MQSVRLRSSFLIAILVAALAVTMLTDTADAGAVPRWPTDARTLEVSGWSAGQPSSEFANGAEYVSWAYRSGASNVNATVTISTSPVAKRIYRAGPEVPFLGNGFEVEPAPYSMVAPTAGRGALIARRGDERFLAIHTYGERRGRLDNGVLAWGLNIFDTLLGRPNDYYLARVIVPLTGGNDDELGHMSTALADELFPRFAAWYGQA